MILVAAVGLILGLILGFVIGGFAGYMLENMESSYKRGKEREKTVLSKPIKTDNYDN